MIKKGKNYSLSDGDIRILDVTNTKAMHNAIIEVSSVGESKGNVELKIHSPSVHKKKGATIKMRKMSGLSTIIY